MGQRIFGPAAEGREPLFQLKALAVGALDLGGVSLVSADPNGGQAAVIGVLAVVRAVVDGAADALIGGALAAVVGAAALFVIAHCGFLPNKKVRSGAESVAFRLPDHSVSARIGNMQLKIFEIVRLFASFYIPSIADASAK